MNSSHLFGFVPLPSESLCADTAVSDQLLISPRGECLNPPRQKASVSSPRSDNLTFLLLLLQYRLLVLEQECPDVTYRDSDHAGNVIVI